jgi:ABC-type nitrate/sulfonate/bicarbonate transport system ATPase subunit
MVRITNLTKIYRGRDGSTLTAIANLSVTIRDGEVVTVIGPSGCGKTTLLRVIAGLVASDAGEVLVDDRPVRRPGPDRAVVFQHFALLPWKTALDNVAFGLELAGVPPAERRDRARGLVKLVGLDGFEHRLPRELSGGMQQRVGLARALLVAPAVLLMDEPFGSLDDQTRRMMQDQFMALHAAQPKTVLFITHSMEEAVRLGDRVVLMTPRPGRVREIIDVPLPRPRPDEVEATREFVELKTHLWRQLRSMYVDPVPAP